MATTMEMETRGIELPNPSWEPNAYSLAVTVPHAISSSQYFLLKETISVKKKKPGAIDRKVNMHCGSDLNVLFTDGASIVSTDSDHSVVTFEIEEKSIIDDGASFTCFVVGQYRTDMKGFYKSTFTDSSSVDGEGVERTLLSTHFEPIAARSFFICVDEPSARCDITISLTLAENEENSLSVAASGGREEEAGRMMSQPLPWVNNEEAVQRLVATQPDLDLSATYYGWNFSTVPKISTYLSVLMVGPMDHAVTTAKSKKFGSLPIRYFIPRGTSIDKIKFALDAAREAFEYFEEFFAPTPFPLPKLDLAAIPQFSIGGEESFGLITTYTQVLMSEATTAVRIKSFVAALIAHELSHNWFGDLVSVKFWSGLYLKEGFASYFGWAGCQHLHPEWEPMEAAVEDVYSALETDGFEGTHPLEQVILDEGRIVESFDSISYNKGQGLVFMLASFLGDDLFRKGLSSYISKFSWESTSTSQLWEALEESTDVSIAAVMNDFVTKPGHPIVKVSRNESDGTIQLAQVKYRTMATTTTSEQEDEELWNIPVTLSVYRGGKKIGTEPERKNIILSARSLQVSDLVTSSDDVILVNEDHTGFFRTSYDPNCLKNVLGMYSSLSARARRGLIDDIFALTATRGAHHHLAAVNLIQTVAAAKESSFRVLQAFSAKAPEFLSQISSIEQQTSLAVQVYEPYLNLIPKLGHCTVKNEEPALTQLRPTVWKMVCLFHEKYRSVVNDEASRAVQDFDSWVGEKTLSPNFSDPDMANALAARFVRIGGERAMEQIWEHFKSNSEDIAAVRLALSGLSQTRDQDLFDDFIKKGIQAEVIHSQFGAWIMMHAASNTTCNQSIWAIFKANFDNVVKNWGSGQFRIQSIVESVSKSVDPENESVANEWRSFFIDHPIPNATLAIQRGEERIRLAARLKASS